MAFPNPTSETEQLETNLAYYLQNCEPGDPRALELLIENYGAELMRLAAALLDSNWRTRPSLGRVLDLAITSLAAAHRSLDSFWGESNVQTWMFRLMVSRYRREIKRSVDSENPLLTSLPGLDDNPARDEQEASFWSQIDSLPEQQRLPLILRCLHGFAVPEIAWTLSKSPSAVEKNLNEARRKLGSNFSPTIPDPPTNAEPHTEFERWIRARHDGLLETRSDEYIKLREHLRSCQSCRDYSENFEARHTFCEESLGYRWPGIPVSQRSRSLLAQEVKNNQGVSRSPFQSSMPFRQVSFLVLIVGIVAALFWSANQYLPEEPRGFNQPTQRPAPTELPLPTPVGETPSRPPMDGFGNQIPDIRVEFNLQPAISGDGRWIAYTAVRAGLNEDVSDNQPGVFLYDQVEDVRELVSVTDQGEVPNEFSYSPSISDDGQRIVFASAASNLSTIPRGCQENINFDCMDIYLRDRSKGTTDRISLTDSGGAPNGPSFSPLLSADGSKVYFWSSATNLITDSTPICEPNAPESICAYLFEYDFESETFQQLLIGRKLSQAVNNQEFSVSGDGQVVALTIETTDQIAEQLGLSNERDVFVFNLEEKTFGLVNLTKAGQPGNGPSDQPAISADGRFVTFSSEAGNLVENDTNESRDIFVRDLETEVTELVSVDSNGELSSQGVGDPTETMNGIASQKIGISEDGRFIVFTAQRSDLSPGSADLCENSVGTECLVLYIHDRLTGETEHIDPLENRRLQMNLLPDISSNGRWITFMELVECPGFDVCFDVGFFDRELNKLRNLSRRFITDERAFTEASTPPNISQGTVWTQTRRVQNSSQRIITRFQRINKLAFSEDGRMFATGAQDGSVQIWDTTDLSQINYEKRHLKAVTDIAFSPDSRLLATASMDGFLNIWDIDEERMIFNLLGEAYQVYSLSFSPDGRWLAGGTSQGLVVWEFTDRRLIQRYLLRQPRRVRGLAFSPDSAQLALAADDNSVWVLNVQPFEVVHRLGGQDLDPLAVAFSPDGNYLAVGTMDGSLNLWEISTSNEEERDPRLINTLWHPEWVHDLAFSPDGKILATLSNDYNIRLWSVPGGELIAQDHFESSERALSLAFSPNGRLLATSTNQGGIVLWQDATMVDVPRFFSRLESDALTIPPDYYPNYYPLPVELIKQADTPDIVNRWSAAYNQSIYQAVETLGLNLKAPAVLPDGMRFKGAKTEADDHFGLSIFYYEYAPAGDPLGAMFLVQASSTDIFPTVGVGASARVERVSVDSQLGEYVRGDWQAIKGEDPVEIDAPTDWQWNPDTPVKRLQWQQGNLGFSLTFVEYQEDPTQNTELLSQDDLLEIAGSISAITPSNALDPILTTYEVQSGDTCTAIAQQFGTQVDSLVTLNALSENCELIYSGQQLQVPVTVVQEPLFTLDLDCNGSQERVMILIDPNARNSGSIYGFTVQTLASTGLYQDQWSYNITDTNVEQLNPPSTFSIDSCQRGLRMETINPIDGSLARLEFRWDGEKMVRFHPEP